MASWSISILSNSFYSGDNKISIFKICVVADDAKKIGERGMGGFELFLLIVIHSSGKLLSFCEYVSRLVAYNYLTAAVLLSFTIPNSHITVDSRIGSSVAAALTHKTESHCRLLQHPPIRKVAICW